MTQRRDAALRVMEAELLSAWLQEKRIRDLRTKQMLNGGPLPQTFQINDEILHRVFGLPPELNRYMRKQ